MKQTRRSMAHVAGHHMMPSALFVLSLVVIAVIGSSAFSTGAALTSMQTSQTGVIAFRDDCTRLLYAMHADGTGRIALPLPPKPEPASSFQYLETLVLDVTTSGPLTVVYYVGISPNNSVSRVDYGLFAVQLNDFGGVITADPPVRLSLPPIAGADPNSARRGAFSSIGFGDRIALVAQNSTGGALMTAKVDRDLSLKITGLSDLVVVGDLSTFGLPDPGFPTSQGFTGWLDYSPYGSSIVTSIYYDLWRIHLGANNTYLSAERLTENTDGFAEWNPTFSPDGSRIAYTRGSITRSGGAQNLDIYTLDLGSRVLFQVTSNANKGGAADNRNNARWSQDGASIGFSAFTSKTARNAPCSGLVNSEIFLIRADGSSKASKITNTNGTSVEAWPSWGW